MSANQLDALLPPCKPESVKEATPILKRTAQRTLKPSLVMRPSMHPWSGLFLFTVQLASIIITLKQIDSVE